MFRCKRRRKMKEFLLIGFIVTALSGAVHGASESAEYVADAEKFLANGEVKAAVIQLKNALQADPLNVEARVLLGNTYLRLADGKGAEKEFSRAKQLEADPDRWVTGLGQALALQNKFQELLDTIQADAELSVENRARVLAMRGHAHLALQQIEDAIAAYDQSLELNADIPDARLGKARVLISKKDTDAARQELDLLIEQQPDLAEARVVRGELARQAGDLDAAFADFTKAKELAPNNRRAYIGHGLVAIAQRKADLALADVEEIRQRFGEMPFASYIHAMAAFQTRDLETAQDQLQLVLRVMPTHLQSLLLYGVVAYAKNDYQTAEDYLARVATSLNNNPSVAKLLAAARLKLRSPDRAIEVLKPMADRYPDDAQLLALLGNAYLQAGKNSEGSEYMAKAVELDPDQALLRTQLALGRLAGGDTDAAIAELESAVDLGQDIVQADVLLVLSYLNKKEHDKALEASLQLEKRMADSPIPYNLTGLAYLATRNLEQAEAKFLEALKKDPEFVVANMNRARLALVAGTLDAAEQRYQDVLAKQENHLGALMGMASLAQRKGDREALEDWLTRANRANPQSLQPLLLLAELHLQEGNALKAAGMLSGLPANYNELPAVLRVRGMAQLQGGDFSSAVRTLQKLVDKQPDSIEGWFQLARAQAAAGDLNGSRISFNRSIDIDKDAKLPMLRIGLGELELRAKNYNAALAIARGMQKNFPDNALGYEIEAAAYRGLGQMDKTLRAVEKAVRTEGSSKRINLFAHSLSASGDPQRAIKVLQDWLKNNDKDGTSWTTLGMLQQQLGQNADATRSYENALQITPDNPVVLNNIAWLYHLAGDKRALEKSAMAYEIAPERPEIVDTYGWILYKNGKVQQGLIVLQQALVAAPRNAEIGLHVAEALRAAGREREARPILERVLQDHAQTEWEQKAQVLLNSL